MTEGTFLEGNCLDTFLLNLNNYIPQIYQAKKIILVSGNAGDEKHLHPGGRKKKILSMEFFK